MMGYDGICWDMLGYDGICWDMGPSGNGEYAQNSLKKEEDYDQLMNLGCTLFWTKSLIWSWLQVMM